MFMTVLGREFYRPDLNYEYDALSGTFFCVYCQDQRRKCRILFVSYATESYPSISNDAKITDILTELFIKLFFFLARTTKETRNRPHRRQGSEVHHGESVFADRGGEEQYGNYF